MHKTLILIHEYEQGHLCSVLSPPEMNPFSRAQAAPSWGDTATLPSHPTTLSCSFLQRMQSTGNSAKIRHIHHKEYEQHKVLQTFTMFILPGNIELSRTSLGIYMQCWWYQTLQASHSAILSPAFSGKRQEQCSSILWTRFIPEHLV